MIDIYILKKPHIKYKVLNKIIKKKINEYSLHTIGRINPSKIVVDLLLKLIPGINQAIVNNS